MLDTEWPDSWRAAFRIELRAGAIGLAWRGWPVIPGTYPDSETSAAAGAPGEPPNGPWVKPAPAHGDWQRRLGAHPQQVAAWWTGRPYSLLVATGVTVDAVEVDDHVGRRAAVLLRATGQPAPIVAMPNGRWLFLTGVADRLPTALAETEGIEWHGEGSWIPLPPTPFQHGVVHWRVKPDVWGWRLPRAEVVHDVLVRACGSSPTAPVGADTHPALSAGTSAA
ncbi:DNA primase [Saccharomonospora piscinae]|uniref:DNA primase n=1 Tax=Saccharomonospora piscinae TaxID=687388 RepID=A0A1V9A733_SACPI|nr:bifunctional DNA primase/polymerase [Saccharomonospora piscinae]OQO92860.1 DNA primase [Saccharomonospora piscinae]